MTPDTWQTYSEVCGFIGNSLLAPMTQTEPVGLDPEFWEAFPDFDDAAVKAAIQDCVAYAEQAARKGIDMVERVSVEYTKLFIGPPSPAAAPWETAYRNPESNVGFGEATFQMRELLRQAGLALNNKNNQYEDHMGIELLLLSEYCRRQAVGEKNAIGPKEIVAYNAKHPLAWAADFRTKVEEAYPEGYYVKLLALAEKVLLSIAL